MRDFINKMETFKEPTKKMSVLFLVFLLCGIYLGCTSISSNSDETISVFVLAGKNGFKLYLQTFALHLLILLVFIKGYRSTIFVSKACILSAIIPALCGINIGKLIAVKGFIGFSAGIVSYMPHYVLLMILYRKIFNKVMAGDILLATDYLKYVIILSVISLVHIFISGTLSVMLV